MRERSDGRGNGAIYQGCSDQFTCAPRCIIIWHQVRHNYTCIYIYVCVYICLYIFHELIDPAGDGRLQLCSSTVREARSFRHNGNPIEGALEPSVAYCGDVLGALIGALWYWEALVSLQFISREIAALGDLNPYAWYIYVYINPYAWFNEPRNSSAEAWSVRRKSPWKEGSGARYGNYNAYIGLYIRLCFYLYYA